MADSGEPTTSAATTTARSFFQPCSPSLRVQVALYLSAAVVFLASFTAQLIGIIKETPPKETTIGFIFMTIDCACLLLALAWIVQLDRPNENPQSAETDIDSPDTETDPTNDNEENLLELGELQGNVPVEEGAVGGAVGGAVAEVQAGQKVEKQIKDWKGQGETQVADRPKSADKQDSGTKSEPKAENKPDNSEGKSVLEIMKSLEEKMQTSKIPIIKFTSFDSDEPLQNGIGSGNGVLVTSDA